jgi:hypothetical protein
LGQEKIRRHTHTHIYIYIFIARKKVKKQKEKKNRKMENQWETRREETMRKGGDRKEKGEETKRKEK